MLVHFHKLFIKLTSSIAIVKCKSSTPFILSGFLEKLILPTRKIGLNFVDMSDNENRSSDKWGLLAQTGSGFFQIFNHLKTLKYH